MAGALVQVGGDGRVRVKSDANGKAGVVVAGDGDPCCCESITTCCGIPLPTTFLITLASSQVSSMNTSLAVVGYWSLTPADQRYVDAQYLTPTGTALWPGRPLWYGRSGVCRVLLFAICDIAVRGRVMWEMDIREVAYPSYPFCLQTGWDIPPHCTGPIGRVWESVGEGSGGYEGQWGSLSVGGSVS